MKYNSHRNLNLSDAHDETNLKKANAIQQHSFNVNLPYKYVQKKNQDQHQG